MDVREKLVELLENASYEYDDIYDLWDMRQVTDEIADFLMAHGVMVQEWISVKDRLPEKDGQYLIFTTQYFTPDHIDEVDHRDGVEISGYYKGYGFLSTNGIYAKYWCCLPQPPKGE